MSDRKHITDAIEHQNENRDALCLASCARYVGNLDAAKAFEHIYELHLIDGWLEPDVKTLRDRWRTTLKDWIKLSCPHLMKDLQGLI